MSENPNPIQALFRTFERFSNCVQTHIANFTRQPHHSSPSNKNPLISLSSSSSKVVNLDSPPTSSTHPLAKKPAAPVTKEELGRATWTFLHTLGAQASGNIFFPLHVK
ncbi:Erv1/Alr [Corchorus capsularis]|uniref:Erv1/Alr n=1 Tax=Corchorus capsularis TaxID=210143 RepID=A0A1R3HUE8_COCAP|nr:Erv1/Alr [Corchorus capsularis]